MFHPTAQYVTGLVDAAGTFTYSRSRGQLSLYFAIRLRAVDAPLLSAVRRFFGGAGRIYSVPPATERGRRTAAPASYYRVNRIAELRRVVEHFDRFPLNGSKRRAYEIWREMVVLKVASLGAPPTARLLALARKLTVERNPG